jgi:VanZ family protein
MSRATSIATPRVLLPLAVMAAIFALSAQSALGSGVPEWTRWVAHFTEYFTLTCAWSWALWPSVGTRGLLLAAAISVLYAVSDEYHQSFVPGRLADPKDAFIDTLGVGAALLVAYARGRASTRRIRARRG